MNRRLAARHLFVVMLALALLTASARTGQMPIPDQALMVEARAVARPQGAIGPLRYLGGWTLHARHPDFGGWSGMMATPRGLRLVSDAGALLDLPWPNTGQLRARLQEVPKGCGHHWHKEEQDAEAVTTGPEGRWWISLEHRNEICRITPQGTVQSTAPSLIRHWSPYLGGEAMLRLRDGRFLVFAEADPAAQPDSAPLIVFSGDPLAAGTRAAAMRFAPPPGFRPVDAGQLPDGRILVLLRQFAFPIRWRSALAIVDPAQLRAGAMVRGQEIARLAPPLITDNFEALAITQEKRRTIIWLASDDNFWPIQQTYLLKFALKD